MLKRKLKKTPLVGEIGDISAYDDSSIEINKPGHAAQKQIWHEARVLLRDVLFALMIAVLTIVFIVQPVKVEGSSMLPRLHHGERIFVNKMIGFEDNDADKGNFASRLMDLISDHLPKLDRGDIVVFWYPEDPSKSYIKRILGLPGETVEIRDGIVFINGQELDEPYLDPKLNVTRTNQPPVYVKNHYYFVMGDNRDHSSDSRMWGLVPEKYIYGKALFRYWPFNEAGLISHDDSVIAAINKTQ
jgi:signal peptidase I